MTGHVGKVKNPENIAVIGAGIGGLCAAARLAKAGHNVTIFEASDRTGGSAALSGLVAMHLILVLLFLLSLPSIAIFSSAQAMSWGAF
jgi:glycine/D-amino acid oxidase-like deaminating enzyme